MSQSIIKTFSNITEIAKTCIRMELKPDGILSDVTEFRASYFDEHGIDPPGIWMVEHPTYPEKGTGTLDQKETIVTPFEFVCVDYMDDDDYETSDKKGKNLASRVGSCIIKNWKKAGLIEDKRIVHDIRFKNFYPVGEVRIEGKSDKVPATSIIFDFRYRVDWEYCNRKYKTP